MLGAVIFDFDGVIADSELLHFEAFKKVLAPYPIEFTKEIYFEEYLGLTDKDLFNQLVDEGRIDADGDIVGELVKQKNQIFEGLAKTNAPILPGVREFIGELLQNKIPIAVCSGALRKEIELILDRADMLSFFEVIVSADDVAKGKPDPQGFVLTLEKLNEKKQSLIKPNQCIVIEDSHWGLDAAIAAGMHTVAVTNSYPAEQLQKGEKIVASLGDLKVDDLRILCK